MSEDKLIEIFCSVDDFCQEFMPVFEQHLLSAPGDKRRRARSLEMSEILTLLIFYHHGRFRHFKHYYCYFVRVYLQKDFPGAPSYSRWIQWMPYALLPLLCFLQQRCLSQPTGIQYIDSTPLVVCHNRRIRQHKTFDGLAQRGKTSVGWFFGFKLHLIINDLGQIVSFVISPGNASDKNRELVWKLCEGIWGKLFGDKGYISAPLAKALKEIGIELIYKRRKKMKAVAMPLMDRIQLAKRSVIECTMDALKNQAYVEHSRHRSFGGLIINVLSAICAFAFEDKKPKPQFDFPFLVDIDQKYLLD